MIFGKLLGGLIGFAWFNVLGALLGLYIGHQFDKALSRNLSGRAAPNQARIQQAFFRMTFLTMGKLAKADGRVSEDEIRWAEFVMARMNLPPEMRRDAMALFAEGKQASFDLERELAGFRQVLGRHATVIQMFLEIQIQAAYADGALSEAEHRLLRQICRLLGISELRFEMIHQRFRAEQAFAGAGQQQQAHAPGYTPEQKLTEAYQLLGVEAQASDAAVKKAYRRLMSQHHPDKLVAKGLPEEMMKLAKEKTQEIQAAYDLIKKHRKG